MWSYYRIISHITVSRVTEMLLLDQWHVSLNTVRRKLVQAKRWWDWKLRKLFHLMLRVSFEEKSGIRNRLSAIIFFENLTKYSSLLQTGQSRRILEYQKSDIRSRKRRTVSLLNLIYLLFTWKKMNEGYRYGDENFSPQSYSYNPSDDPRVQPPNQRHQQPLTDDWNWSSNAWWLITEVTLKKSYICLPPFLGWPHNQSGVTFFSPLGHHRGVRTPSPSGFAPDSCCKLNDTTCGSFIYRHCSLPGSLYRLPVKSRSNCTQVAP